MYDLKRLELFLRSLEEFYKPEKGKEKMGIGHEIEHINGVMLRTKKYVTIVNSSLSDYGETSPVDYGIAATCAALHDIGNEIERDGHNHFGFGIIKGRLTIDDYFSVPVLNKSNGKYLTPDEISDIKESIEKNGYLLSENFKLYEKVYEDLIRVQAMFEIAYKGKDITNESALEEYLVNRFPNITNKMLSSVKNEIIKNNQMIVKHNPKLKNITVMLENIFGKHSDELDIIAKAVQDHNVDYKNKNLRYVSRSIYGSIVSDADKDNSPEVFAIRTIAYAANKLGVQKHIPFCVTKNPSAEVAKAFPGVYKPNIDNCIKHVCHQSWERFRISEKEFEKLTGRDGSERPFFAEIAEYKKDLSGVKGILDVSSVPCPDSEREKQEIIGEYSHVIDSNFNLITFMLSPREGEDKFSELDYISGKRHIRNARANFFKKVEEWSDVEREKESLKEIKKIAMRWVRSKSNEEIIGKYEAQICEELKTGEMKEYSFTEIVRASLNATRFLVKNISESEMVDTILHGTQKDIEKLKEKPTNPDVEKGENIQEK